MVPEARRLLDCPYDLGAAKARARAMLAEDPPSAVLCGNDIIAHGVLYAAHSLGVVVPARLSVVGIGDFRGSADIEPALSTVRLPARRIGREGADALVGALQSAAAGAFGGVIGRAVPVEWVERGSTEVCGGGIG